jgi:hypothetical protein
MNHTASAGKPTGLDSAKAFLGEFAMPSGGPAAVAVPLSAAVCCSLAFLEPAPGFWGQLARYALVAALAGGVTFWLSLRVSSRRQATQRSSDIPSVPDRGGDGAPARPEPLAPVPQTTSGQSTDFAAHAAAWLSCEANASRVAALLINRLPAVVSLVEERELWEKIARSLASNLGSADLGPTLRRTARQAMESRDFDLFLGSVIDGVLDLAFANWKRLQDAVERENLWWMPRSMDRRITNAILRAFEEFAEGLRSPDSEGRQALIALVEQLADGLAAAQARIAETGVLESRLAANPLVQGWLNSAWAQARQEILEVAEQHDGESALQGRLTSLLVNAGHMLADDAALRQWVNQFIWDLTRGDAKTS